MTGHFFPDVETVYHKDYQCDYYRGVIVDGEGRVAARCQELRPDHEEALRDAERKMAGSPRVLAEDNFGYEG